MKFALVLLLLLSSQLSLSQKSIDLLNIYWRTSPANAIDGSNEKRNFNMYTANAKAPIVLNDKNVLIFGLEYQHTTITSPSIFYLNYSFSSSMLQVGWEHKWSDKSKLLMMALPRFNSDFEAVDASHLQIGGLLLGTQSRSEKFDWKYGVYYNSEFFGPMIVPLFGFNWQINDQWQFNLLVPLKFDLIYTHTEKLKAGLMVEGVNASYRYQVLPGSPWTNRYIDRADNNAWLFSEFHLGKNIWFHVKAGYSVLRKYRFFDPNDKMAMKLGPVNIGDNRNFDNPSAVPVMFKNGFSFETRFIYRLPF